MREQQQQALGLHSSLPLTQGLIGHEQHLPQDLVMKWSVEAVIAAASYNVCAQRQHRSLPPLNPQSVLTWLCRIAVNGIALKPVADSGEGSWGSALFPVAAYFNHSCFPNTTLR